MSQAPFITYAVFTKSSLNFNGNTSSVVILPKEIEHEKMQSIAADFCQPATTFLWKVKDHWEIRWFAPDAEIPLCGHGATAAIAALIEMKEKLRFYREGEQITGIQKGNQIGVELDAFPIAKELEIPDYLQNALGIPITAYYETSGKNLVIIESEQFVKTMKPDFAMLRSSDTFSYAVTAPGNSADFVSRTLVPHVQALEDAATGSSHAALVPYWAQRLSKSEMTSHQLSKRGGFFNCTNQSKKVILLGEYQKLHEGNLLI